MSTSNVSNTGANCDTSSRHDLQRHNVLSKLKSKPPLQENLAGSTTTTLPDLATDSAEKLSDKVPLKRARKSTSFPMWSNRNNSTIPLKNDFLSKSCQNSQNAARQNSSLVTAQKAVVAPSKSTSTSNCSENLITDARKTAPLQKSREKSEKAARKNAPTQNSFENFQMTARKCAPTPKASENLLLTAQKSVPFKSYLENAARKSAPTPKASENNLLAERKTASFKSYPQYAAPKSACAPKTSPNTPSASHSVKSDRTSLCGTQTSSVSSEESGFHIATHESNRTCSTTAAQKSSSSDSSSEESDSDDSSSCESSSDSSTCESSSSTSSTSSDDADKSRKNYLPHKIGSSRFDNQISSYETDAVMNQFSVSWPPDEIEVEERQEEVLSSSENYVNRSPSNCKSQGDYPKTCSSNDAASVVTSSDTPFFCSSHSVVNPSVVLNPLPNCNFVVIDDLTSCDKPTSFCDDELPVLTTTKRSNKSDSEHSIRTKKETEKQHFKSKLTLPMDDLASCDKPTSFSGDELLELSTTKRSNKSDSEQSILTNKGTDKQHSKSKLTLPSSGIVQNSLNNESLVHPSVSSRAKKGFDYATKVSPENFTSCSGLKTDSSGLFSHIDNAHTIASEGGESCSKISQRSGKSFVSLSVKDIKPVIDYIPENVSNSNETTTALPSKISETIETEFGIESIQNVSKKEKLVSESFGNFPTCKTPNPKAKANSQSIKVESFECEDDDVVITGVTSLKDKIQDNSTVCATKNLFTDAGRNSHRNQIVTKIVKLDQCGVPVVLKKNDENVLPQKRKPNAVKYKNKSEAKKRLLRSASALSKRSKLESVNNENRTKLLQSSRKNNKQPRKILRSDVKNMQLHIQVQKSSVAHGSRPKSIYANRSRPSSNNNLTQCRSGTAIKTELATDPNKDLSMFSTQCKIAYETALSKRFLNLNQKFQTYIIKLLKTRNHIPLYQFLFLHEQHFKSITAGLKKAFTGRNQRERFLSNALRSSKVLKLISVSFFFFDLGSVLTLDLIAFSLCSEENFYKLHFDKLFRVNLLVIT